MPAHDRRLAVLRWLLGLSIVSTALHFTHNFVAIDQYPQSDAISNTAVQVAIVVSWPLLTGIGLLGYRRYAAGRYDGAHLMLAVYALLPLATLGHYTTGNPDIAAFWYATIITDGLLGIAMLAFVVWSARAVRQRPAVTA
jgi:uncharacterized membrane-anchored protein